MSIYERAREIIFDPRVAWQQIKSETTTAKQLIIDYAAPLALVGAVCSLIGYTIFGLRLPSGNLVRAPFFEALIGGFLRYVLQLAALLVAGRSIAFLGRYFNSKTDFDSAMKLVVYSMTPVWLAGVFTLIPGLSILSLLGFYGLYVLVVGLPEVLATPGEKVFLFAVTICAIALLISVFVVFIIAGLVYGPMFLRMMAA